MMEATFGSLTMLDGKFYGMTQQSEEQITEALFSNGILLLTFIQKK